MDEKESIPEKSNEDVIAEAEVSPEAGDQAGQELETREDTLATGDGDKSGSDVKDSEISETLNRDSELQNHVGHGVSTEDSSSVRSHADDSKHDIQSEVDSQPETKEEAETTENVDDILKEESNSQDASQESTNQEHSQDSSTQQEKSTIDQDDSEKISDIVELDHDEKKEPQFENAPNITLDETQEDHTQALDPFDALLKDTSDTATEAEPSKSQDAPIAIEDDDDDNHADNADGDIVLEEDEEFHPDVSGEEPGADEEVCLLPDTEREISEADKAEAEKVLAEKRKLAQAGLVEAAVPKEENETPETDDKATESANSETTEHVATEAATVDASQENGGEKENENENEIEHDEAVEIDENLETSIIQEISPTDDTCVQCKTEQPCSYRFSNKEGEKTYLCKEECVKAFQAEHPGRFTVTQKKYLIEEISPKILTCSECEERKTCYFYYNYDGDDTNYCSLTCLHSMMADEKDKYIFKRRRIMIEEINQKDGECLVCNENKKCNYLLTRYGESHLLCDQKCMKVLNGTENGRYSVKRKRTPRKQPQANTVATTNTASNPPLLKLKVISNATDKYLDEAYKIQAKTPAMVQAARDERERTFNRRCSQCRLLLHSEEKILTWETMDFCDEVCLGRYQNKIGARCANCKNTVLHTSLGKYCVRFGYDIRQFCNSVCLEDFKKGLKICCYCQRDISIGHQGFLAPVGDKGQFKDFCSQICVGKFDQMSKNPMPQAIWSKCAVCSLEKSTSIEVEVSEDASQRLCSDPCFAAFKFVNNIFPDQCKWCKKYFERKVTKCFTIYDGSSPHCFCSKACMNVYISNSRHIVPCNWCKVKKYNFDMIRRVQANGQAVMMCSLNCLNLYQVSVNAVSSRSTKTVEIITSTRRSRESRTRQKLLRESESSANNQQSDVEDSETPAERGREYIERLMLLNALELSTNSPQRTKCDMCKRTSLAQYHLTMSDATVRNFCTYQCVMSFQGQYSKQTPPLIPGDSIDQQKAVPTGAPRRTYSAAAKNNAMPKTQTRSGLPVIASVQSLAAPPPLMPSITRGKSKRHVPPAPPEPEPPRAPPTPPPPPKPPTPPPPPPPKVYNHVIVKTLPPREVANKGTMSKPMMVSKGVSCRPHPCTKECQTDPSLERRVLIPVPVPIYVPVPCAMWSLPFPVPVPIPIPIPTPIFIPTTRNSAKGIMKEINKIHDKMPTDPFEAELLMMAEMVAGDKKKDQSDSDTDDDNAEESFSPVAGIDGNNAFGEDMLQMALKMATEYEDQPVDLESAMTANTITPSSHPGMPGLEGESMHHHHMMVLEQQRAVAALRASSAASAGRKRVPAAAPQPAVTRASRSSKRRRAEPAPPPQPDPPREPAEKPDANMCLKYTFGVNAWKQWVMTKNAEIEKSSIRRKPFKSEILQLTADELNYSLCLFVKEVRKPNGSEYAPDTIYYLVLGIQQYLFENGRIDNIFTDPYYEKFTDCLDEVARKFSVLYNDSQYIVTRVEEEHLWESKQLGAHSPHVLLSTLMFFNTKHFNLVTVDEHMQLSFSHIMKHWKRNPNQPGQAKIPGSRNVLLRFYPPQSALEANSRKKKVYEQQENEENPLRCPVKLYEFYISKCPESVRTRNDVFYLQPERSCVPDSPVWYSTQPLSRAALAKMLHRVKMVKEINIALLTS